MIAEMDIQNYYNDVARRKVRYYQEASWFMNTVVHHPIERCVRKFMKLHLRDVVTVTDIGCGDGMLLQECLDNPSAVTLVDPASEMLAVAEENIRERLGEVAITRHQAQLPTLSSVDSVSEIVICIGVLNHLAGDELLASLKRLCELSSSRVAIYYAHTGFLLSSHTGRSFRAKGIPYESIERELVRGKMKDCGFVREHVAFSHSAAALSPMVCELYKKTS